MLSREDANQDGPVISPVYAYRKNPSLVDYPGQMAALLFTSGCTFRCGFCHNAALMGAPRPGMPWKRLLDGLQGLRESWANAAVITGGEPTLHDELPRLLTTLRGFGWKVKLDTNGSNPGMLAACLPLLDSVAMDIKTCLDDYSRQTGVADVAQIAASVRLIRKEARDYEFRTTVLPEVHTEDVMRKIGAWIGGSERYVLQAFVPTDTLPDARLRKGTRTQPRDLVRLRDLMQAYVPNVRIRGEDP